MNDLKFTTAGDYMADYSEEAKPKKNGSLTDYYLTINNKIRNPGSWREPGKFQSVITVVKNKEQIYDIRVEREVAEIINTIMLREYTVMRYELGITG